MPSAATTASANVSARSARRSERAMERRCIRRSSGPDRTHAGGVLRRGYEWGSRIKSLATMAAMSLARVWRRQLYGASSVALIVPAAMLVALMVLALGGAFSQVGVLGQIFA